jgi:DNA-binding transcriptional MerR regulator
VGLVTIGEFPRLSRLSTKALRLYDGLGLLVPDHVDAATGYHWYAGAQLSPPLTPGQRRRKAPP